MTGEDDRSADQNEKFQMLKNEVEALQLAVMGKSAPWYKNLSILISVIALLFSFGTTYVSYKKTQAQDIQNARVELRQLLQRLSYLPRDNFELTKKYENDPSAIALLGGFINQENSLLARQAAEITRQLPRKYVSGTEYYSVAAALQASYNIEGAKEFLALAVEASKDFSDKIAAIRASANLMFISGQPEAGRMEYRKALNIFLDYEGYDEYTKKSTHVMTELSWAFSEANIGLKDLAMQHIANAESNLSGLVPSPGVNQLRGQIAQAKAMLNYTGSKTP